MHRFYLPQILNLHENIITNEFVTNHIKALRIKPNQNIIIFNHLQDEYLCIINKIEKNSINVTVKNVSNRNNDLNKKIHIYQSIINPSKLEIIAEKANELGAYSLNLFKSKYSNFNINDNKLERLKNIVISSSEQCNRNSLLKINLYEWKSLTEKIASIAQNHLKVIFLPNSITKIKDIDLSKYEEIHFIIGSEGGFCAEEINTLQKYGFLNISLINNILRSETATISATAFFSFNL